MIGLGAAALFAALPAAAYAGGAALAGRRDARWAESSRRAIYALCALLTVGVVLLEAAFLRSDFSLRVVAEHSSTTTPTFYKLTAMWSSQAGSLLLWAWVLSIASSAVLYLTRNRHRELTPYATAVLAGIGLFFIALMLAAANPFARLDPAPLEGAGLNPLLRNPYMVIHPPMLYSGYVAFSIPFAFAIAALITRRLDASWIRSTRVFALMAWTFLAIGLVLGSRWSYEELGWGGYWGWDPVENAALMPWLIGTAFLHSIMVQERRGMLKTWNVSLIVAAFSLALLGTFLVRSGILQSIHAFGASTVGGPLLGLIAVVVIGSTALIVSRLDELRSERRVDSLLSRESVFLVNNLLLVGLCAVVFWGTFFPLIAEVVTGEKASLAAPWFNRYVAPFAILLVLFTGIGPLLAWGRMSPAALRRALLLPGIAAIVTACLAAAFTDAGGKPLALLLFSFAAFALVGLGQEFVRGSSARRALAGGSRITALGAVVARNRRRYGGYIVHAGIGVLLIGVAASSTFQTNRDLRLAPGESSSVGGYDVRYVRPDVDVRNERIAFGATLDVRRDGRRVAVLHPARNYYPSQDPSQGAVGRFFEGEATSEVGLRAGAAKDIWTAFQPDLSALDRPIAEANRRFADAPLDLQGLAITAIARSYLADPPPATFRVIVNPGVSWMWIGAMIAVGGALLGLWPSPGARRRAVTGARAARLGQEPSQA